MAAEVSVNNGAPIVKLAQNGLLSGTVKISREGRPFYSFMGIPYATIPGRFEAAKPIQHAWRGIKSAEKAGSSCTQKAFNTLGDTLGDEICLFINVYVSNINTTKKSSELPTLIWIHGGGFTFGDGTSPCRPSFFMDEPVILVTFNYRLGVFGFLSTGDDVIPGNNGLKDQVAAFKWVQNNIPAFGGNPKKVTIFGVSAGGASVHYHLLSSLSTGLFHGGIAQSGSALSFWAYQPNPKENAVQLATYLNCSTMEENPSKITSLEILDCLKNLSKEELNEAQFKYKTSWPSNLRSFNFLPVSETKAKNSDNPFITASPMALVARGEYASKVPLIIGTTEDEGATMYAGVVLQNYELVKELDSEWDLIVPKTLGYGRSFSIEKQKVISDQLRKFYFGSKAVGSETAVNLTNMYSDVFNYPVYKSAKEYAKNGNQVFLYQYAMPGLVSIMGMPFGVTSELSKKVSHADEIQYLFDLLLPEGKSLIKSGSQEEQFSKHFVRLWTTFAKNGNPNHSWGNYLNQEWKPISQMELDGSQPIRWYKIEQNPHTINDPYKERMRALDKIFAEYYAQGPT
ncbi:Esterase FE4 [Orchesella cincta]|uniref:Carboxylic ester hydrolase n=1 Tax=Orchesella cincta TaxID=48709 RepID=A0A1D2M3A4_ORCCI|nr:Esterase FE4 [Orchesella cincta]